MKSLFNGKWSMVNGKWSMANLFTRWRHRRQRNRKQRETQQTLQMWALLEKLFDAGQISFDRKAHRLFITQPVASLLMSRGADAWVQSVHNIYNYVHFLQTQQAWDEYMQNEELAAVRDAMQAAKEHQPIPADAPTRSPSAVSPQPSSLSRSDIDRIRIARRQQIAFSDMEPPKVEPFEFFIIPLTTEAKVEPIAVGYYDPNTAQMDVASWSDVAQLLKDGHQ